jgi:hypothetical protein
MPAKGHALQREGAAFQAVGGRWERIDWRSPAGTGRALCECGAVSDVLPSANKRKAWHRAHKSEGQP